MRPPGSAISSASARFVESPAAVTPQLWRALGPAEQEARHLGDVATVLVKASGTADATFAGSMPTYS
jgi:Cu/Zn superoxide dismutase